MDYNLKFFLYNSCRWFSLISANDNKFAQEPLESTFFDCLKKLPYKDISILASYKISNLFNEIECSPVFDTEEFYKEENDRITNMNATFIGKNSMIKKFYGLSQLPLFFEIYNIRSFDFDLMSLDNPQEATIYYKDFINQIKNPVVKKRADNIYNNYFGDITDYVEIPESKNKEILNSILEIGRAHV